MEEELVLAVPTAGLFAAGAFQGLQPGGAAWLDYIFQPRHSRFLTRAAAEQDPDWKQVIPYVILLCGDSVFCYRRGQQSSEARLRALHSIGLGGHIRAGDDSLFAAPGWFAYQAGLQRELHEEVDLESLPVHLLPMGLINDDATPVGRVHIGLVHLVELTQPAVRAREKKIAAGHFAPLAQLRGPQAPELESWSSFCLAGWERLRAEPGWQPSLSG
ncbi:MAG: hypothetical protein ACRD04_13350 [Terriglobales bacterium]